MEADESLPDSVSAEIVDSSRGVVRRVYYGYWLLSAGFIAQFVSIGLT